MYEWFKYRENECSLATIPKTSAGKKYSPSRAPPEFNNGKGASNNKDKGKGNGYNLKKDKGKD